MEATAPTFARVTRCHDIRHIFRTPALFSAANANSPLRAPCPMATAALNDGGFKSVPTLANADPPAHTRVRKAAMRAVSLFACASIWANYSASPKYRPIKMNTRSM